MQCKDVPELPVLRFLSALGRAGTAFPEMENSVQQAMPAGTPANLARAKMGSLIRRKLVKGCVCGCRGDFELTDKGRQYLATQHSPVVEQSAA